MGGGGKSPPPKMEELGQADPGRNEDGIALTKSVAMKEPLDGWDDVSLVTERSVSYKARARGKIFALEAMPGGRVMCGGMMSGDVEIFHPENGAIERVLTGGHHDAVLSIATTPAGIFTAGADSQIIKWGTSDLQHEGQAEVEGLVTSIAYAPNLGHTGLLSATSTERAPITLWNIETVEEVALIEGHRSAVLCMCIDDAYLYCGCSDGSIVVYEVMERLLVQVAEDCHAGDVWAIHSDGAGVITSAGEDGVIRVWNYNALEHGTPIHELKGHRGAVRAVLSYEGLIFSTGADGFVVVWDTTLESPAPIEVLFANIDPAADPGRQRVHLDGSSQQNSSPVTPAGLRGNTGSSGQFTSLGSMVPADPYAERQQSKTEDAEGEAGNEYVQPESPFSKHGPMSPEELAVDQKNRSAVAALRKRREVPLSRRFVALGLEGNELVAGGFDGYVVKWNVETLLPVAMEVVELPPLVGGTDAERDMFAALDVQDRHERLQRREVRRALPYYTELPINFVINSLNIKVKGSWLSMEMIPFLLFLILFTIFVLNEYSIIDIFNMTHGVRAKVEYQSIGGFKDPRAFADVKNLNKYETFLFGAFVPKLWEANPAQSEWYESRYLAGQNELASAIRFRTQRAKNDSCGFPIHAFADAADPAIRDHRGYECFHELQGIEPTGQAQYGFACEDPRSRCVHNPAQIRQLFNFSSGLFEFSETGGGLLDALKFYGPGGYSIDIPASVSYAEAENRVRAALDNGFIDNIATRIVIIEFFHYNAVMDIFVSHKYIAEVLPGGAWYIRVLHFPFAVFDADSSIGRLVYEAFFFLFVLYWTVKYFADARRHWKLNGNILGYFLDVWSLLELVNTVLFLASFGLRWAWFVESTRLTAITRKPFDVRQYPTELDFIRDSFLLQVYINSVNTVLTYLKILKFVQLNDKLNILTRALSLGSSSIIGVLGLFVYFVFAFAMCGFVLFGSNVFEYRTPDAAYNSLLRLLVGDYDYDALSNTARGATVVFFWAYTVMSLFILLNFLVAVLADAFNEAVGERLPIPMDDAIIRAARQLARSVSVKYIRITLVLFFHRSSKTALTAEHARGLREWRDGLLSAQAREAKDYGELDGAYITKEYFIDSVPEMLRSGDNLNFMDEVWSDMAYEWHYRLRDKSNRERHEQEELAAEVLTFEMKHVAEAIQASGRAVREMSTLCKHLQTYAPVVAGIQTRPGVMADDGTIMQSMTIPGSIASPGRPSASAYSPPLVKIQRKPAAGAGTPSPQNSGFSAAIGNIKTAVNEALTSVTGSDANVAESGKMGMANPIAGPPESTSSASAHGRGASGGRAGGTDDDNDEAEVPAEEPPTSARARAETDVVKASTPPPAADAVVEADDDAVEPAQSPRSARGPGPGAEPE